MAASMPLEIRPLGPARRDDYLELFEQRAFTDNPGWASCYCHFPHADHAAVEWSKRTGTENRGQGVARALLDAACEGLASARVRMGGRLPAPREGGTAAENHFGPLALYRAAGFEQAGPAGTRGVKMRKRLVPATT